MYCGKIMVLILFSFVIMRTSRKCHAVYRIKKASELNQKLSFKVTDEPEFSKHFLQDLKNLAATAENIFKKVQDTLKE